MVHNQCFHKPECLDNSRLRQLIQCSLLDYLPKATPQPLRLHPRRDRLLDLQLPQLLLQPRRDSHLDLHLLEAAYRAAADSEWLSEIPARVYWTPGFQHLLRLTLLAPLGRQPRKRLTLVYLYTPSHFVHCTFVAF